jgi:pimeloyl-ACP methyl ester carboxylesterase
VTRKKLFLLLAPLLVAWGITGCGTYMAKRMVEAPNSYPQWLAPEAPVLLAYSAKFLTNFPRQFAPVGPPAARLCYRVIEPADYHLTVSSTNWLEGGKKRTKFEFTAVIPAPTNRWTAQPRGTVFLLHGYALAQFSMAPWALRLAQEGWRCVLVDLRGHGRSTGDKIYYGLQEPHDLTQLMDKLSQDGHLQSPVAVMGESYGAAIALRWQPVEPRICSVVAITPYAGLSNTVMNLRGQYAAWCPKILIRAGLKKLPSMLGVSASELDTTTVLARNPEAAFFVAATDDKISPAADVEQVRALASPQSQLLLIPDATHETVTYHFAELAPPVVAWLTAADAQTNSPPPTAGVSK